MDEAHLYQQIAESIRREILEGKLKPGQRIPSVRQLCVRWGCTPGTIQRAFGELAHEGLLVSRAGRGTQVAGVISQAVAQAQGTFRRVNLVHRSETFLLESLTAGYDLSEIQIAMDMAMDRWRAMDSDRTTPLGGIVRFSGSHDMVLNDLARTFFGQVVKDFSLQLSFTGSLGGLMALAQGRADLAGCHLWDAESDTYNLPFIRRLLPGKDVVAVTLAHRRQGLILPAGNPLNVHSLRDLTRPSLRFANRQSGSGTRVWLDSQLSQMHILPNQINGYEDERLTHSEVARAIAEGAADVGLGLEIAARAFGLDFLFLNRERYDLVMRAETAQAAPLRGLLDWLASAEGKEFVARHPGYESEATGQMIMSQPPR